MKEPVIVRISGGGRLLVEQAIGWIHLGDTEDVRRWRGSFKPRRTEHVAPGGHYLLETSDGRSGHISIDAAPPGALADADVTFTGIGPFG